MKSESLYSAMEIPLGPPVVFPSGGKKASSGVIDPSSE
jgi:hypothetical protein